MFLALTKFDKEGKTSRILVNTSVITYIRIEKETNKTMIGFANHSYTVKETVDSIERWLGQAQLILEKR